MTRPRACVQVFLQDVKDGPSWSSQVISGEAGVLALANYTEVIALKSALLGTISLRRD
ncbi:hypothetical protein BDW67DRAFT_81024 [Aspergillus spinulosporus]